MKKAIPSPAGGEGIEIEPQPDNNRFVRDFLIIKAGETFPVLWKRRGDFEDWIIASLGLEPNVIRTIEAYKGYGLPDPRQSSGAVITGSNAMVTEHPDWSQRIVDWLQKAMEANTPLLGICYGHQLMAYALGGSVGLNPKGSEMGTIATRLTTAGAGDPLFKGFPRVIQVQTSHFQSVLTPPPEAMLLATSARDPHHAFAYGGSAWSVQFHPEFDADVMRTYIDEYADALSEEGIDPISLWKNVENTPFGTLILKRFGRIAMECD